MLVVRRVAPSVERRNGSPCPRGRGAGSRRAGCDCDGLQPAHQRPVAVRAHWSSLLPPTTLPPPPGAGCSPCTGGFPLIVLLAKRLPRAVGDRLQIAGDPDRPDRRRPTLLELDGAATAGQRLDGVANRNGDRRPAATPAGVRRAELQRRQLPHRLTSARTTLRLRASSAEQPTSRPRAGVASTSAAAAGTSRRRGRACRPGDGRRDRRRRPSAGHRPPRPRPDPDAPTSSSVPSMR